MHSSSHARYIHQLHANTALFEIASSLASLNTVCDATGLETLDPSFVPAAASSSIYPHSLGEKAVAALGSVEAICWTDICVFSVPVSGGRQ